jgi:hypothetical protein
VLLGRVGSFGDARANNWVLFGLGLLGRGTVEAAAEGKLSAALYQVLEPLWIGLTESWLVGDRTSLLEFLSRQTVRKGIIAAG